MKSVALAIFLLYLELPPPPLKTNKSNKEKVKNRFMLTQEGGKY
jgi:hypothetical protein